MRYWSPMTDPTPQNSTDLGSGLSPCIQLADITREAYIYLGAGATVLRQMANPGVGLGVAEHSRTLDRPLDRLRGTMDYIYVISLGTDAERQMISHKVNRAHGPVRSERYNAFDPQLQLWVAATLYRGAIELYQLFNGQLDEAGHDEIYRQAAIYGTSLQLDPAMWPADRAAFEIYWAQSLASFEVPESVRLYVQQLLKGGAAPWYIKMLMPLQSLVTRALLAPRLRDQFGLPWTQGDERVWRWFCRCFFLIYRLMPRFIRYLPMRLHLRGWRKRNRLLS